VTEDQRFLGGVARLPDYAATAQRNMTINFSICPKNYDQKSGAAG
jgi:hypothetical protein